MKNKILLILIFIYLGGCSQSCSSPQIKQVSEITFSCKKPVAFVFINGIDNEKEAAEESVKNLSKRTHSKFKLLYNVTEGFNNDVIQTFKQKKAQKDFNYPEFMIEALTKAFNLTEKELNEIYTPIEKEQIDDHVGMSKDKKLFIVAHSQGNFFANEICARATIQPELHGFATPVSNKAKCEKNFYTFKQDRIIFLGRFGNYDYVGSPEGRTSLSAAGEVLSFEGFKKALKNLYYHSFETYLLETQKPINDLMGRIPKDDSRKPIIESLKVIGPQGAEPIILNGKQYPDGISCKDITSNFLNVVTPTLDPFYPDQIFGFKYAVKMKGAEWVYLKNKANNSSHYALTISKAETDPSSATDKYVIKDAGFASLFGADPPKPQPRSIASPLPPAKPSTIASPQMPRGEVSPTTQRSQPPLEMVRP